MSKSLLKRTFEEIDKAWYGPMFAVQCTDEGVITEDKDCGDTFALAIIRELDEVYDKHALEVDNLMEFHKALQEASRDMQKAGYAVRRMIARHIFEGVVLSVGKVVERSNIINRDWITFEYPRRDDLRLSLESMNYTGPVEEIVGALETFLLMYSVEVAMEIGKEDHLRLALAAMDYIRIFHPGLLAVTAIENEASNDDSR